MIRPATLMTARTYEQMLDADREFALNEGGRFFEGRSAVPVTLHRIAARLKDLGVPYAVIGGMALFAHGYRRFTEDVDILVTSESLKRIHESLEGRGYLKPFPTSRHLRDTETKVKIEFLVSGGFPGDGKPKAISFPDPADVSELIDDVSYITLTILIELKIASGLSGANRERDLIDVQELIRTVPLERSLGDQLDSSVRAKYFDMWDAIHQVPRRYFLVVLKSEDLSDYLDAGLRLTGGEDSEQVMLETSDPGLARRFGMEEMDDFDGRLEG